jgi:exosortase A-associated hydrolase 2
MDITANSTIEPFFLTNKHGSLFCLSVLPTQQPIQGSVLYLPPFGEEMHKSRRTVALQARQLAAIGYAVLQIDLTGCGDSTGDFSTATWSTWQHDAHCGIDWLRQRFDDKPVLLWGLRLGATLAATVADLSPKTIDGLLLWQPIVNGETFLNQFLRLKLTGDLVRAQTQTTTVKTLRAQLQAGDTLEIGGYALSPTLAHELTQLQLDTLAPIMPTWWFEIQPLKQLSPLTERVISNWQTNNKAITTQHIVEQPFWHTQEIVEATTLLATTTKLMHDHLPQ